MCILTYETLHHGVKHLFIDLGSIIIVLSIDGIDFFPQSKFCFIFRYGCPGSEEKEFNAFADFYDKHYSGIRLHSVKGYQICKPQNNGRTSTVKECF